MDESHRNYLVLYLVVPWVARIRDLCSLNLVSRAISLLTHPYLFKSIRVDIKCEQPTSPKLEALKRGWHLASHLRTLTLRLEAYGHHDPALASGLISNLPNLNNLTVAIDLLSAHVTLPRHPPRDRFVFRTVDFGPIAWSISKHQLHTLRLITGVYGHFFDCPASALHEAGKGLKQIDLGNAQVSTSFLEGLIDGGRESIESLRLPLNPISPFASGPFLYKLKCPELKKIEFRTRRGIDMRCFLEGNPWITQLICGGRVVELLSACPSAESISFMDKISEPECIDALLNLPNFSTLRRLQFSMSEGPTLAFESCLGSLPSLEYLSCTGQLDMHDCNNNAEHYDILPPDGSPIELTQVYTCNFPSLQFVEVIGCPFRFIGLPPPPLVEYYGDLRGESHLLRWKFEGEYGVVVPTLTPMMIHSVQMPRVRQWAEGVRSLIDIQTREFVNRAPKFQRARFRPYANPPYDSDLDIIINRHTNGDYFVLGGFGRGAAGADEDGRLAAQLQYDGPWTTCWESGPFSIARATL